MAPVFVDGRLLTTLKGDHIVAEFPGVRFIRAEGLESAVEAVVKLLS